MNNMEGRRVRHHKHPPWSLPPTYTQSILTTCEMAASELVGGRGDPSSTMLWSPDRICGSKRTLAERTEMDADPKNRAEEENEGGEAAEDEVDDTWLHFDVEMAEE